MPNILKVALAFFVLGAIALVGLLMALDNDASKMKIYGEAPSFELTDTRNEVFRSDLLKGKVWIADFFFSTCAGPCPTMGKNMQKLHEAFQDGDQLRLVNFTVYPDHDTPEVLAKYAAKFRADTSRWHFLTGPADEILRISTRGFMIGDPDVVLNHSQKFALVDRNGAIRGYYDGTDSEAVELLIKDIKKLL